MEKEKSLKDNFSSLNQVVDINKSNNCNLECKLALTSIIFCIFSK